MRHGAWTLLIIASGSVAAFAPHGRVPHLHPKATNVAQSRIVIARVDSDLDAIIDELLAEREPERLPALLGRRLNVLTDKRFLPRIETRRVAATPYENAQLQQLGELVVSFLEELTEQMRQIEPELVEAQAQADAIAAKAAQAAVTAQQAAHDGNDGARNAAPPTRRAQSTPPANAADGHPAPSRTSAEAAPSLARRDEEEALEREARAKHRFLLERLLDAAQAGGESLDQLLRESRADLDAGFFEHLQWEVDEQRKQKNRKLLTILEVVVQRACAEVEAEAGRPEVALLSALLQTANPNARREMYERELRAPGAGGAQVAAALVALVTETQLELEKRVLKGEQVDPTLLQMLRVLALEGAEYSGSAGADDLAA